MEEGAYSHSWLSQDKHKEDTHHSADGGGGDVGQDVTFREEKRCANSERLCSHHLLHYFGAKCRWTHGEMKYLFFIFYEKLCSSKTLYILLDFNFLPRSMFCLSVGCMGKRERIIRPGRSRDGTMTFSVLILPCRYQGWIWGCPRKRWLEI